MRCKDCPYFVQEHWTEGGFDEAECRVFGSVDGPEISENRKGSPGCRYNRKFLEAARLGEQLAYERYLAECSKPWKVLYTSINNDSHVLTDILISPYKTLSELFRAFLHNHVKGGSLFRAVAIDAEEIPKSVDRWLRGFNEPKPENALDVSEHVPFTIVHPDDSTTYVCEKS